MTEPARVLKAFSGDNAPEVSDIPWIVPRFLARGAGTIMAGQPGVSKSVHAAILCASLWKGEQFAALEIRGERLRVLYVDLEKGWNWTGQFFLAAFRGLGIEGLPSEFRYYSPKSKECLYPDEDGFVTLESMGGIIAAYVKEHKIDVVVIDSLGQFISGDQNNAQDVSLGFRAGLNPITTEGAAVLVIDHTTKGSREGGAFAPTPAGSQQKRAWAVVSVVLEQEGEKQDGRVRWTVDKTNAEPFAPFITRLEFQSGSQGQLEEIRLSSEGDAGERKGLEVGGELAARRAILEQLKTAQARRGEFPRNGTYDRAFKDLLESGEITQPARGVYALAKTEEQNSSDQTPNQTEDTPLEFAPPHQPLGNGVVVQSQNDLHQAHTVTPPLHTKSKKPRSEQVEIVAPIHTTPEGTSYDLD